MLIVRLFTGNGGPLPTSGPETNGPQYIIRHSGGRCLAVSNDNHLSLTSACKTRFYLTSKGKLKTITGGKCFKNVNSGDNSPLKVTSCGDLGTEYTKTRDGAIQQLSSGRCFHPLGGSSYPSEGTKLVVYNGCDGKRLNFKFETGESKIVNFFKHL